MKQYETYIFDLDGTLLSTLEDLAASTNYALRTHSLPEHSVNDVRMFVGNGVRKLIERAVPGGEENPKFEDVLTTFRSHYMEHSLDTTKPYPGVMEMLRELKSRGKHIAVVSNKFHAATKELCRHFFGNLVEVAVGESSNVRKKPAPDTVEEVLKLLNVSRNSAVYIGDSDVDIDTARNSRMECISVLWGFRDKAFLVSHGATTFISSPSELFENWT